MPGRHPHRQHLLDGCDHDLLVEDSSNVVVGPNNFDRNPRYNYGNSLDANGGLVFRNSRDCTGRPARERRLAKPSALASERCDRFNISNCTILDSDGIGLWLQDCTRTRVAGCLIRDDRAERKATLSLKAVGGRGNWITQNLVADGHEIAPGTALVEGNFGRD